MKKSNHKLKVYFQNWAEEDERTTYDKNGMRVDKIAYEICLRSSDPIRECAMLLYNLNYCVDPYTEFCEEYQYGLDEWLEDEDQESVLVFYCRLEGFNSKEQEEVFKLVQRGVR
jgi:hypothetical protein